MKKFLLCVVFGFLFCGCFAILEPAQTKHFKDIEVYDYAYLNATQTLNSGVGAGVYGYYGGSYSVSKSINPADMIAGILMKKGFIIVNDTISHTAKTLIVNYGQSGKRDVVGGLGGYTLEVSIQILDAQTKEPVYVCTAEGQGSTEADDIREAITRCLAGL